MLEYIQRLGAYLVQHEGFQLMDEGSGLLGRQHWGVWQLVRLVDGDRYSEDTVEIEIRQDVKNFEEFQHHTRSTGVTGLTILVFRESPGDEKLQRLLGLQHKALWQNVHNLIWVVDLEARVISHQGGLPGTGFLSQELLVSLMSEDKKVGGMEVGLGKGSGTGLEAGLESGLESGYETGAPEMDSEKRPWITYSLISINILVWVLMTMSGGSENSTVLQAFGAKVNSLIVAGEYWRLLTPVFLHIGIDHLIFNCFALYQLGTGAEYLFGKWKYLFIYLVAGIFGNLGSFVFSSYLSAGASGSIFGIMGAYLYFGTREKKMFSKGLGGSIITILVINIVYGLLNARVDNFAHLGGLAGGFLISSSVGLQWEKAFKGSRLVWLLGSIVLFLGLFQAGLVGNI